MAVKKVITAVGALVLAACTTQASGAPRPQTMDGSVAGGADAMSALRGFMAAAKQQNVKSLSMWWGDSSGPTRETMDRDQLEKRELIMLRCLKHDRYDVVGEAPSEAGARDVVVNMVYHGAANTTHVTVVPGPGHRWFVKDIDLNPLHTICTS